MAGLVPAIHVLQTIRMAGGYVYILTNRPNGILYVGDSANDAPMFDFFRHTVGVSTVLRYLSEIPTPPSWISEGPGGAGFVEAANAVISSRSP